MRPLFQFTLALASVCSFAQAQSGGCDCPVVFDTMIEKLENNYIGLFLTRQGIDREYQARKSDYRKRAAVTASENCTQLMQTFLSWFKDGHLFVSEYPKFQEADLAKTKSFIKENILKPGGVLGVAENALEGYWTDGASKYRIVPNQNSSLPFTHIALIEQSQDSAKVGEIKFGVNENYEGTYYTNSYAARYVRVTPYKDNTLLSIWGGIVWGRLPSKDAPVYNPSAVTFTALDEKKGLLTLPSFLIEGAALDKVLKDNKKVIGNLEDLIIDIRGNTGGNGIYFNLISAYYDRPYEHVQGFALSSDDNLAYFEKFASNKKNDPYAPVVAAMKKEKGKLVAGPDFGQLKLDAVDSKLKRVVILTDRACMSAAETFVLYSKALSTRVITMGDNTGGVVDYNNINMVPLSCEKHGIHFGYPTYTRDDKVLTQGYNKTGIPPDVRIDQSVVDKVAFVVKYLDGLAK